MSKFKVGQKVRFKSYEELERIGERWSMEVDFTFKYTTKLLTITCHYDSKETYFTRNKGNYYQIAEWKTVSNGNCWLHEDFFQPAYELDDKFKGL